MEGMSAACNSPVVVFDGDCSFCRIWVGYGQELTGDQAAYEPYQTASERFPDVPREEFQRAVQLFEGGRRSSGAEAVFRLFALVPGYGWLLWVYEHLPGFAPVSEAVYRLIATHRNAGYRVTQLLWGKQVRPSSWNVASAWFARAMALIFAIAFASFGRQVRGLIGLQGIQPVSEFLVEAQRQFGAAAFWKVPTLFWWAKSELGLLSIVWGGAVLSAVAGIARPHSAGQKAAFTVAFVYYLSVVQGGQIFMGYQWDYLLLEAGFLAIFLKPVWIRVWLFRWLLFRLMFESGAVKLLSGDMTWRNLTALNFHFETQPLPTPLAWYANQAPHGLLAFFTLAVFAVELILPFFIFGPRRLKHIAAFGTIGLQIGILLTGNYTFFNVLTIALCLFLFDDAFFSQKVRVKTERYVKASRANGNVSLALAALILALSAVSLARTFEVELPGPIASAAAKWEPFGIVNNYGLFAVMTTTRPEISLEGSDNGTDWAPYVFRYKPGPLNRAPGWVAPNQPRLDWQMWFAALGSYRENPWLVRLMERLLQNSPPVLELLEQNPFAGRAPRYVRAMVYEYRFTNSDERRRTGNWWKRELKGTYFPPVSLRGQQ
jgi:predicted DCC family thiol-disulfide oxidoreductase YuxK